MRSGGKVRVVQAEDGGEHAEIAEFPPEIGRKIIVAVNLSSARRNLRGRKRLHLLVPHPAVRDSGVQEEKGYRLSIGSLCWKNFQGDMHLSG